MAEIQDGYYLGYAVIDRVVYSDGTYGCLINGSLIPYATCTNMNDYPVVNGSSDSGGGADIK